MWFLAQLADQNLAWNQFLFRMDQFFWAFLSAQIVNFYIIYENWSFTMQTEKYSSEKGRDFWENANKYSWSNGEYGFLKEMSFIMVSLHHQNTSEQ